MFYSIRYIGGRPRHNKITRKIPPQHTAQSQKIYHIHRKTLKGKDQFPFKWDHDILSEFQVAEETHEQSWLVEVNQWIGAGIKTLGNFCKRELESIWISLSRL